MTRGVGSFPCITLNINICCSSGSWTKRRTTGGCGGTPLIPDLGRQRRVEWGLRHLGLQKRRELLQIEAVCLGGGEVSLLIHNLAIYKAPAEELCNQV